MARSTVFQATSLACVDHVFQCGDPGHDLALEWAALGPSVSRDVVACVACVAGRSPDGARVTVQVHHRPWIRVGRADGSDVGGAAGVEALLRGANLDATKGRGAYAPEVSLERVTPFEGFGRREREVGRLSFLSIRAMRWAAGVLAESGAEVFEGAVDPSVQFASDSSLSPTGWLRVEGALPGNPPVPVVRRAGEVHLAARALAPVRDAAGLPAFAPHRFASLDVEAYSSVDGNFPSASEPGDAVFAVSIVAAAMDADGDLAPDGHAANAAFGSSAARARVLVALRSPYTGLAPAHAGEGVDLRVVDTEGELLGELARAIRDLGVDVLSGWNVHGFDMAYLRARALRAAGSGVAAEALGAREFLRGAGALFATADAGGEVAWRDVKTGGDLSTFSTPGMLQMDALPLARILVQGVPDHKLGTVATELLGRGKADGVDARRIFASFRSGTAEDLAEVARYCVLDSELVVDIARRTGCVLFVLALAEVAGVTAQSVVSTGQMFKVYSAVWCEARRRGFALATPRRRKEHGGGADGEGKRDKLPGGHVFDVAYRNTARTGHRLAVLDFASLYPSVIQWGNLCPSTARFEESAESERHPVASRYGANVVAGTGVRESDGCMVVEGLPGGRRAAFAPAASSGRPGARDGVLPSLLRRLVAARSEARATAKRMRATGERGRAAFYDAVAQAIKVLSNSVYGSLGTNPLFSKIAFSMEIAFCITAIGRLSLVRAAELAEERSGEPPLYGDTDSVMVPIPPGADDQFGWARELADEITALFGPPMCMEFEYLLERGALFLKPKTYAALARAGPDDPGKLIVRGLANVRDDSSPLLRACFDAVLRLTVVEARGDHAGAAARVRADLRERIGAVRKAATAIGTPRVSREDADLVERSLVVTKSIKASAATVLADHEQRCHSCGAAGARRMPEDEAASFVASGGVPGVNPSKGRKSAPPCLACPACGRRWAVRYVDPEKIPHVRVAMELERANPGGGGFAGDRVGYLVVRAAARASDGVSEMARHPAAVLRGFPDLGVPPSGEQIDWARYYEPALHDRLAPLVALACAPFVPDLAAPAPGAGAAAWAACVARTKLWMRGQQKSITDFMTAKRPSAALAARAAVPDPAERVARFFSGP